MLVSVEAPHFCASIELQHDIVVRAAPILRWTIGQHRNDLRAMFARKGWHAKIIGSEPTKKGDIAPNRDDTPVDLDGMAWCALPAVAAPSIGRTLKRRKGMTDDAPSSRLSWPAAAERRP